MACVMTKSPVALGKKALRAAKKTLPAYSSPFLPKAFTQHQLFAILVLRQFCRTDYRGIVQLLHDLSDLCDALDLKKVPHDSTLCYAEQRLIKKGLLNNCWPASSNGLTDAA